jgi:hypothetical protein
MNLVLHRSDDFNLDFDLQYRWYLEQAGGRWLNATWMLCWLRCVCWPRNPAWGAAGSSVIRRSEISAHSDWLRRSRFICFSTASVPPDYSPNA